MVNKSKDWGKNKLSPAAPWRRDFTKLLANPRVFVFGNDIFLHK